MNDTNSSLSTATNLRQATHEEISRHAQELWEKYGRPSGRDEEIWLEAERTLQRPATAPSAVDVSRAPTAPSTSAASGFSAPPSTTSRAPQKPSRATATPRMPGSRGSRSGAK